jgi:mRNA interferase YafQ
MLVLAATTQYRKDRKLAKKRGLNMNLLDKVIQTLLEEKPLDNKHRDHQLSGNYVGMRECHIANDWLLIYGIDNKKVVLTLLRTGTHSDFGW